MRPVLYLTHTAILCIVCHFFEIWSSAVFWFQVQQKYLSKFVMDTQYQISYIPVHWFFGDGMLKWKNGQIDRQHIPIMH